jgi:2,3-bisphosphoglycerate-independent phosphoglycerate mutase
MKKVLVVIDGMGDIPEDKLGGKTPLESAYTPNLDEISKKSKLGHMYPISEDYAPESDTAVLAILGNRPDISARGEFEAVGCGVKSRRGDLVLRANFATVENIDSRKMIDRRAGRTLTTKEAKQLALAINKNVKLPVKFHFFPTVQHRAVLVFYGGFSDNVTNIDTYVHEDGKISVKEKFDWSQALDEDENTEFSANIINSFVNQSFKILENHPINLIRKKRGLMPANIVLARDAGIEVPTLNKFRKAMAIVNMPLEKGISKISGMEIFSTDYPDMKHYDVYENLYEGLNRMVNFATTILKKKGEKYDFCYIHFKETDIPGHDNKPMEKKTLLEMIDKIFFKFMKDYLINKKIKLIVTADHSTPCKYKTHTSSPVPVLVYNPEQNGDNLEFGETNSKKGSFGKVYGKNLLKKAGFTN